MSDTIYALSTAPARSGVAVIRISGNSAEDLLSKVFRSKHPPKNREMTLGTLVSPHGRALDRCLAVLFKGHASYTGEPSAELHLHGSPAVISAALDALGAAGGRPANAGEFTRRAFLNGKLDLAEAEAVGELIAAETSEAAENAVAMLSGALGRMLKPAYDAIIDLCANLAAEVDYPDDDIEPLTVPKALETMFHVEHLLKDTLERSERARAYTEGVRTAIVGAPNAGKSTLFNAILGERRAIVTDTPGTTRDLLRERATLGGVPLILTDTAGLRDAENEAERIGVQLAREEVSHAELALLVVDASRVPTDDDRAALSNASTAAHTIVVMNKIDRVEGSLAAQTESLVRSTLNSSLCAHAGLGAISLRETGRSYSIVRLSAKSGDLAPLEEAIRDLYHAGDLRFDGTLLTNARQRAVCLSALDSVRSAIDALNRGLPTDLALNDAERAAARIGGLFGRGAAEDVIDRVFSNFCVGK